MVIFTSTALPDNVLVNLSLVMLGGNTRRIHTMAVHKVMLALGNHVLIVSKVSIIID